MSFELSEATVKRAGKMLEESLPGNWRYIVIATKICTPEELDEDMKRGRANTATINNLPIESVIKLLKQTVKAYEEQGQNVVSYDDFVEEIE